VFNGTYQILNAASWLRVGDRLVAVVSVAFRLSPAHGDAPQIFCGF
jgi:hypothetical protein